MNNSLLMKRVADSFASCFGVQAEAMVQAPGRVNLIGEHTDYNDGFVLPCAIDRGTVIAIRRRQDRKVRVLAIDQAMEVDEFDIDRVIVRNDAKPWTHYVRGMVQQLQLAGLGLHGLDMAAGGDVPQGAGLSSSASLVVAVGQAFRHGCGLMALSRTDLALMAQRAENKFVGCQCGIMDQLVSARAQAGHALLIDCRSLEAKAVRMPAGVSILIVHSMVERGLVDSLYNERRTSCEAAAHYFGVPALRDVSEAQLDIAALDELTVRRCRHVITENTRTQQAAEALVAGNLVELGKLMKRSHLSMRHDFEITVPPIDHLVEIMGDVIGGEGGCRMTGGGFGGCAVAIVRDDCVNAIQQAIAKRYRSPQGLEAKVFICQPSEGAGVL